MPAKKRRLNPGLVAKFPGGHVFKALINTFKDLVNDFNLKCTPDGIAIDCMDTSHISMISVLIRAEDFEEYSCEHTILIGLNATSLSKIMKSATKTEPLKLVALPDPTDLTIIIGDDDDPRADIKSFEIKIMDIDEMSLGIPEVEYTCKVSLPIRKYNEIISDFMPLADKITIYFSPGMVMFSASGDLGTGKQTLNNNKEKCISIKCKEEFQADFSLRYLRLFVMQNELSEYVTLNTSKGLPIRVSYRLYDCSILSFYLAPKILDDD